MDNIIDNFLLNGGIQRAIVERKKEENSGNVLHTNINDYTVDSVHTFDEGYETAIWYKENDMVIVERYKNAKEMKQGHKKWCGFCNKNPQKVYSVQNNRIENLI